ncbi:hypothetical protein [Bradyrhizobium sp.]|uniref:hypothetical protein n=1 Tax=Bradyrhizobium sp. TaxID=376 RepID=UPI003BB0DD95
MFGIALLLFLEDFAADAFREVRARLLVAPRLAAAAFLEALEALFLRVFCDTACARYCHALFDVFAEAHTKGSKRLTRFSSEYTEYSTFSVKINDLEDFRAALGDITRIRVKLKLDLFARFRTKWCAVCVKKARQNRDLVTGTRF